MSRAERLAKRRAYYAANKERINARRRELYRIKMAAERAQEEAKAQEEAAPVAPEEKVAVVAQEEESILQKIAREASEEGIDRFPLDPEDIPKLQEEVGHLMEGNAISLLLSYVEVQEPNDGYIRLYGADGGHADWSFVQENGKWIIEDI